MKLSFCLIEISDFLMSGFYFPVRHIGESQKWNRKRRKQMTDLMMEKKAIWINTAKWIYWTVTLLFVVTMISAGLTYLAGASFNVEGVTHLGYPVYLLKILGVAKLTGGI